jgi:uncharacterized OB-fold protein
MICHQPNPMSENMSAHQPQLACPHLISFEHGRPSLIGSRCAQCGEVYFPAASGCTRCLATDMTAFDLGSDGILWSWTIQDFLPKAPYNSGETEADFKPYGVGYVQMACGIKVESRLTVADPGQLKIGMAMRLDLQIYGKTPAGESLSTFVFSPVSAAKEGKQNG